MCLVNKRRQCVHNVQTSDVNCLSQTCVMRIFATVMHVGLPVKWPTIEKCGQLTFSKASFEKRGEWFLKSPGLRLAMLSTPVN